MKKVLYWLLLGTKGGYNRGQIIKLLHIRPYNPNQLSKKLNLNYRTITHHLKMLSDSGIVMSTGKHYGKVYFLSDEMEESYEKFTEIWEKIEESD